MKTKKTVNKKIELLKNVDDNFCDIIEMLYQMRFNSKKIDMMAFSIDYKMISEFCINFCKNIDK